MAWNDIGRKMFAYALAGSACEGGFAIGLGGTGLNDYTAWGGTTNDRPFSGGYFLDTIGISPEMTNIGTISYIVGTTAAGTHGGTMSSLGIRSETYVSTLGPVYSTNVNLYGSALQLNAKWSFVIPDGTLWGERFRQAILESFWFGPFMATSVRGFGNFCRLFLIDFVGPSYINATLVSASIATNTFIATVIFGGSNTSGMQITPSLAILWGTMSAGWGLNTLPAGSQSVLDCVYVKKSINDPDGQRLGDGGKWTSISPGDTWTGTFFMVC